MNAEQRKALLMRDTDIDGALRRFCGNEKLYDCCLRDFINDPSIDQLNTAIMNKSWDDAFTAAHALKGLAGNMGFLPLMHTSGQLVIMIRGGRTKEAIEFLSTVNSNYRDITDAIKFNFIH